MMHAVSRVSQDFADASFAVGPLLKALTRNAEGRRDDSAGKLFGQLHALANQAHIVSANDAQAVFRPLQASTAPWEDEAWQAFAPIDAALSVPRLTRVGVLRHDVPSSLMQETHTIEVPALVPIIGTGGVVLTAEGKQLDAARDALQSMLVRLIAAVPPGLMRCTLVDQLGVGNNFSLLTPFHEVIRGQMTWHDPKQIAAELDGLIAHMAMITQKYLKTKFPTIEAFNRNQGAVEEAYRILAIANFPAGFDKTTAEQVVSIAQNGPRSGVYVLLSVDRKQPMPFGFNFADLARFCTVLEGTVTSGFRWKPNGNGIREDVSRWMTDVIGRGRVTPDRTPPEALVERIAEGSGKKASERQSVKVSFSKFVPAQLWTETTANGISVPIGRRGSEDQLFELSVGADAVHHAIIGGRTGSGKSVLIKGLITGLCQRYSPEELELYLIDFKGGVEFRVFSELPHARVVALESEREFGLSVLEGLLREKAVRERKFKEKNVVNLSEYRAAGEKMSRILLVVDEFQVFFESNDRLSGRARGALAEIARLGRSFGIHVVLASQSISSSTGADLDQATLNQFGLRIALAMNESDSYRILSRDNDAAKLLTRAGEAIFNARNGLVGGNLRFQVAYINDAEVDERVKELAAQASAEGRGRKPLLFEGNRPATIRDNAALVSLVGQPPAATPRAIPIYVGEPAAIQESHTFYKMRRQSGDNLIIVGQDEETLFSIFVSALVSWSLGQPHGSARIVIFNLSNVDDPLHERFDTLSRLPQNVTIARNRDIVAILDQYAALLDERMARSDAGGADVKADPVLLAFYGLQRARDLSRDGGIGKPAGKKLIHLIHDGPENGISIVAAADTCANLLRVIDSKDLNDFGGRIASIGGDSAKVLGEHGIGFKVREHYGVLYEPERPDALQKFRTYGLGQLEWLEQNLG